MNIFLSVFYFLLKSLFVVSVFIFFLVFGGSYYSPELHAYKGTAMTIDYHVSVGGLHGNREVFGSSYEKDKVIEEIISKTFDEIDRVYNDWNPNSEVSRFNRLKGGEEMLISEEFEGFLRQTDQMVSLSEGKFDPSIAPLQKIWKEHLDNGSVPSKEQIEEILPAVGWHRIHFGNGKIVKEDDQTSLDLGGIAKGYCVDLMVERIVEAGFQDVIVEWGGEIRAHGHHPANRAWRVSIGCLDDEDPSRAIAQVNLNNQSIATSGDYIQNWSVSQGEQKIVYFHIIDPATGKALESNSHTIASATVLAPTCLFADALAKAAIMQPSLQEAERWAHFLKNEYPEIQFWFFAREE